MHRVMVLSVVTGVFVLYILHQSVTSEMNIQAVDFEVFGRVQGVFFRKHTKAQADRLDIHGWCMNTPQGTVKGHLEGPPETMPIMMKWLEQHGSPSSVIEKVVFTGQSVKLEYDYLDFEIRR